MSTYVVCGAGPIGRATAAELVHRGHQVVLATRSGTDPALPGITATAVDAADPDALTQVCRGADAIVNAVNPPYTAWPTRWPPIAHALLTAAEATRAGLVTVGNLYGYGQVSEPITEQTPLQPNGPKGQTRARMWQEAKAAHDAGRLRACELRASDYFGADTQATSYLQRYVLDRAALGRTVRLPMGDPDAVHTWTYVPDIAALAAELATAAPDGPAWGRCWHVPSAPALSIREVAAQAAILAGRPAPAVRLLPRPVRFGLRAIPLVRELDETAHQFTGPFVMRADAAQETFGLRPTGWDEALRASLAEPAAAA